MGQTLPHDEAGQSLAPVLHDCRITGSRKLATKDSVLPVKGKAVPDTPLTIPCISALKMDT